uniref:Uncharacterized protein n=1 Tax=Romanomermis culicivorax TaxID=13658 RepID=A0A915IJC2_ROMCU
MQNIFNASVINNRNALDKLNIGQNCAETEFLQVSIIPSPSVQAVHRSQEYFGDNASEYEVEREQIRRPFLSKDPVVVEVEDGENGEENPSQSTSSQMNDRQQALNGRMTGKLFGSDGCLQGGKLQRPNTLCSPQRLTNGFLAASDDASDIFYSLATPTKTQVLTYFTQARKFRIRRLINGDIQVTDWGHFPLMDAWLDVNFCYKIWRIESYGRQVVRMTEAIKWNILLPQPTSTTLHDWNGDYFGTLLPEERPFTLISSERKIVARLVLQKEILNRAVENQNGGQNIGDRSNHETINNKTITENKNDKSIAVARQKSAAINDHCWICVLESNGRHLARLENWQEVQFNKDVGFQMKLLILCALIRLVGRISAKKNIFYLGKYLLGCCSGEV